MDISLNIKDLKRFWSKIKIVEFNDCWIWQGNLTSYKGNGQEQTPQIYIGNKGKYQKINARRLSYLIHLGQPTTNVGNSCRNKLCVNPQHLLPKKEEYELLPKQYKTKASYNNWVLTDEVLVGKILKMLAKNYTQREIADNLGLSQPRVAVICKMIKMCQEGKLRKPELK